MSISKDGRGAMDKLVTVLASKILVSKAIINLDKMLVQNLLFQIITQSFCKDLRVEELIEQVGGGLTNKNEDKQES